MLTVKRQHRNHDRLPKDNKDLDVLTVERQHRNHDRLPEDNKVKTWMLMDFQLDQKHEKKAAEAQIF